MLAHGVARCPTGGYRTMLIANITQLFDTELGGDHEIVLTEQLQTILGPPGEPLSRRTVSRFRNRPDGLEYFDVGGRSVSTLGQVRTFVRRRERRPNPRRK